MPEVFILRIIGFTVNFQRDIVRFCILDLLFAGFEIPNPPGSNDLHARRKLFDRQLKSNLVVALARAAVANRIRTLCQSDLNQPFGD